MCSGLGWFLSHVQEWGLFVEDFVVSGYVFVYYFCVYCLPVVFICV